MHLFRYQRKPTSLIRSLWETLKLKYHSYPLRTSSWRASEHYCNIMHQFSSLLLLSDCRRSVRPSETQRKPVARLVVNYKRSSWPVALQSQTSVLRNNGGYHYKWERQIHCRSYNVTCFYNRQNCKRRRTELWSSPVNVKTLEIWSKWVNKST